MTKGWWTKDLLVAQVEQFTMVASPGQHACDGVPELWVDDL